MNNLNRYALALLIVSSALQPASGYIDLDKVESTSDQLYTAYQNQDAAFLVSLIKHGASIPLKYAQHIETMPVQICFGEIIRNIRNLLANAHYTEQTIEATIVQLKSNIKNSLEEETALLDAQGHVVAVFCHCPFH